jgi:single-strand DNA-binding protein
MKGINKVILIGNLGKDPELLYIEGNIAVVRFPLATTEHYKDRNGNFVSQTEWHSIVVWRWHAESAHKQLHKGSLVYIEGRLRSRTWEEKDTKIKRQSTEVAADNIIMLDKKKDGHEYVASSPNISTEDRNSSNINAQENNNNLPF